MSGRGRVSAPGELTKPASLAGPGELTKPASLAGPGDLSRPGSLAGPGSLVGEKAPAGGGTDTLAPERPPPDPASVGIPPGEPLASFALRNGLEPASVRPPAWRYLTSLWQRRQFITGFATSMNVAMYSEARLGQLWQVLTPLLNAGVYYFIFGVLLQINRGVPDFLPFLVTGIFVFNFTQRACITCSTVMRESLPLIRALPFPRACLPLGYVLIELQQLVLSLVVLMVVVAAAGDLSGYWYLMFPVLILQSLFNVGCGFILARWGSAFDDVSQLLPFLVRTWMYASGVIFSIQTTLRLIPGEFLYKHPGLGYLLQINPAAVYITLIRNALLQGQRNSMPGSQPYNALKCAMYGSPGKFGISQKSAEWTHKVIYYSAYCHATVSEPALWLYAVGWAVAAAVIGFFFFWAAETRYGRG
ncbi:MAG TPA: ABC transporter permease [Streptosporangiaceae bacterium]|nr:ABC transporter permease [Streptosporangiaceae bacterium]